MLRAADADCYTTSIATQRFYRDGPFRPRVVISTQHGAARFAGGEAQLPAVAREVAAAEADQCTVGCFPDRLDDSRLAGLRFFLRVGIRKGPAVTVAKLEFRKIEPRPFLL
jgi:hypothetical protein